MFGVTVPIFSFVILTVREITKSSSTFFCAIQIKSIFGTKFSSIYLEKGEKRLVFRLSFVYLQRAKDGTHMFDAKYRYVFVV